MDRKSVFLCPTAWRARELLRDLFTKRGWAVHEDVELLDKEDPGVGMVWCSGRDVPWTHVLNGTMRSNVYYLKTGLNRKADMHQMLEKHQRKIGSAVLAECVPETHILDLKEMEEDEEELHEVLSALREKLADAADLWVLKASESNRGMDVHLFSKDEIGSSAMLDLMTQTQSPVWLLQQCVHPPLLLRGRKFHMRANVLALGDLAVHVHEHVVVIPAHAPYHASADGSVGAAASTGAGGPDRPGRFAFLTNHCVQSAHADYEAGRFMLLRELCAELLADGQAPADCADAHALFDRIFQGVCAICAEVFAATKLSPTGFFPLPHCFELFGFDLMVDEAFKVHLLEVNTDPSMTLYEGAHLDPKLVELLDDTLHLTIPAGASEAAGSEGRSWSDYWQANPQLSSVYVQGYPFFPATQSATAAPPPPPRASVPDAAAPRTDGAPRAGEAEERRGAAGEDAARARAVRFPCVYKRAPRFEGMGGLKVLRGLLKTSRIMSRECDAIGAAASRGPGGEAVAAAGADARREGLLCFVAGYAWYSAELQAAIGKGAISGVALAGSATQEGVGLYVVPNKVVPWDEVLARKAGTSHVLMRRGLLARVHLFLALERFAGGGADGWRSPMPMTLQAAGQSERADWQGELVRMLLAAGGAWRLESMDEGGGTGADVRECETGEQLADALRYPEGHAHAGKPRSCIVQRVVASPGALAGGRRCVVALPVLAAGSIAVYAYHRAMGYVEREGGEEEGDEAGGRGEARSLESLAQTLGGAGDASEVVAEWMAEMRRTVAEVFSALKGQGGQLMVMPHCFQLLTLHFALGPASLSPRDVCDLPAGADSAVRPWLLRVESAMEVQDPYPGHDTGGLVTDAVAAALQHIQLPNLCKARAEGAASSAGDSFVSVLNESWMPSENAAASGGKTGA